MKTFIAAVPPIVAVLAMILVAGVPTDASPPIPTPPDYELDVVLEPFEPVAEVCPAPIREVSNSAASEEVYVSVVDPSVLADQEAHRLIDQLTAISESPDQSLPREVVDDVAALLTRRPETADVFIESMRTAKGPVRVYFSHAFRSLRTVPELRNRLLAVLRDTDPILLRRKEVLASPSSILLTLKEERNARFRRDLVKSLRGEHLADPDIFSAVVEIAELYPVPRVRSTAILRLGQLDTPEVRQLLLDIVRDRKKDLSDRQAAAMRLRDKPSPEAVEEFINIVRRGDAASLMRHSAIGLKHSVGQPEATEALVDLLVRKDGDLQARKNAAEALMRGFQKLEEPVVRSYVVVQVQGAVFDLETEAGTETLLAYTNRILR